MLEFDRGRSIDRGRLSEAGTAIRECLLAWVKRRERALRIRGSVCAAGDARRRHDPSHEIEISSTQVPVTYTERGPSPVPIRLSDSLAAA